MTAMGKIREALAASFDELSALKAENDSLRAKVAAFDRLANAAETYYEHWCIDEADDWEIIDGHGSDTGASEYQILAAKELKEALAKFKGDE